MNDDLTLLIPAKKKKKKKKKRVRIFTYILKRA